MRSPRQGTIALVEDGVRQIAVVLFLLAAGLEVDLDTVWRRGKTVLWVSLVGMIVPFGLGYWASGSLDAGPTDPLTFRLLFATALSISALPVIARILMDLGLYRTETGLSIIGAAVVDDLIGWNIFALVVSRIHGTAHPALLQTLIITITLATTVLVGLRRVGERSLTDHRPSTSTGPSALA